RFDLRVVRGEQVTVHERVDRRGRAVEQLTPELLATASGARRQGVDVGVVLVGPGRGARLRRHLDHVVVGARGLLRQADRAVVADRDAADDVGHAAALAGELGELVGHPLWREDAAALGGRFKRARVLSETLRGGLVVELAGPDKVSEERVLSAVLNAAVVTGVTVVHASV